MMAAQLADYASVSYQAMAEVTEQYPIIGRSDLYFGGTGYENKLGMGVQLGLAGQSLGLAGEG